MALYRDCDACRTGDHRNHRRVVRGVPKGMMGGVICNCMGDCATRNADWAERLVEEAGLAAIRTAFEEET